MNQSKNLLARLLAQIRLLSPADRAELARNLENQTTVEPASPLLEAAQAWLWQRTESASRMEHKIPRLRIWFIYMLIRHAGLRLSEVTALVPDDLKLRDGCVKVAKRVVPLPAQVASLLRAQWEIWQTCMGSRPFFCDASLVRRNLAACAVACQVPAEALNVRTLRRARERELERLGLPGKLIAMYMGKGGPPGKMDNAILRQAIYREAGMLASARNMFYGQVTALRHTGILVEVSLKTESGLNIKSVITRASCLGLQLEKGSLAFAMVKAPWVQVGPVGTALPCLPAHTGFPANSYTGTVARIREDEKMREIIISLPGGHNLFALITRENGENLAVGHAVEAAFSPLAVILTVRNFQKR